jgi:hypothetical protein
MSEFKAKSLTLRGRWIRQRHLEAGWNILSRHECGSDRTETPALERNQGIPKISHAPDQRWPSDDLL